ncbi:MAG: anaerobic ribonucleoside-triphosphate reductase [FCB group bacterium]|nr:anaerobic ribonucleoside-triphosphate reductase [FCB group bacterium]
MRERDENEVVLPGTPEGTFDAQLTFPAPFVEAPQPLLTIVKRDGREEPFQKRKIADAIFHAAESIGGQDRDRADSLASGVAIYLSKILDGRPPTVDEVHDAVEKVLIEMGHARTALVYARHRDKRARMRHLHAGNLRLLLKELAEAEGEPPVAPLPGAEPLFVRTSGEAVVSWDRAKIVAALVRETELDENIANVIASDVEKQILSAGVRTLTAALVRELVDAKLIELGLEEHRRRHARLGVPLYDAERILCAPNAGPGRKSLDPENTNGVLAEQVKREYALSRVFSQPVTDAHLRGDLHLHGLGAVDRFLGIAPSLEYVKLFGALPGARPPRDIEALLSHTAQFTAALGNLVADGIAWDAINFYLAPFLANDDEARVRSVARMLVFLLGHREAVPGRMTPRVELGMCWDTPAWLYRQDAIGPGGKLVGRTYAECASTARRLAWALLEAHREAREDGSNPALSPVVKITHEFFRTEGHEEFLAWAGEAATAGGVQFALDRDVLPERAPERVWLPRRLAAHDVSLNLPRLAYGAPDEAALMDALAQALDTVVRAHREKQTFLRKLLELGEVGPLALLAQRREGVVYADPDRAACRVSPVGLNECVHALTGASLREDAGLGLRLMEHLRVLCDRRGEREGFPIVPVCASDTAVAARFAALDLRQHPEATRAALDVDVWTDEVQYTPGVGAGDAEPMERTWIEGQSHEWAEAVSPTAVTLPEGKVIAAFVRNAFQQTSNARIGLM